MHCAITCALVSLSTLTAAVNARKYMMLHDSRGTYSRDQLRGMCRQSAAAGLFTCTSVYLTGVYGYVQTGEATRASLSKMEGLDVGTSYVSEYFVGDLLTETEVDHAKPALSVAAYTRLPVRSRTRRLLACHGRGGNCAVHVQRAAPYHLAYLNTVERTMCAPHCTEFSNDSYTYSQNGTGVTVYVVSEPMDSRPRELQSANLTIGPGPRDPASACSTWHGNHIGSLVAGNVHGVAKGAHLVSVSVSQGCRAPFDMNSVANALQWILDTHLPSEPAVALVITSTSALRRDQVAIGIVRDLVGALLRSNITVISPAGHGGVDACNFTPSGGENVVTVGALEVFNASDSLRARPWIESNYGKCVDLWAPGAFIESAFSASRNAVYSGTSQAAAITAGVAATILEGNPTMTPRDVGQALLDSSSDNLMLYTLPSSTRRVLQLPQKSGNLYR